MPLRLSVIGVLTVVLSACAAAPAPSPTRPAAIPTQASVVETPTTASRPLTSVNVVTTAVTGAFGGFWTAIDAGYFRDEAIEIKLTTTDSTSRAIPILLSGEVQFSTLDGQTVIQTNLKGGNLRSVAAVTNHLVFSVLADQLIQTPADIKGKRIGITSHGSATETAALQALAIWHIDPGDVTLVPLNSAPNILSGLLAKQLDAGVMAPPTSSRAAAAGFKEILNLAKDGPDYPSVTIGATLDFLTRNPGTALGFVRAYSRGIHRFKTDQAFAMQSLARYLQLDDQAVIQDTWKVFSAAFDDVPYVNPRGVQNAVETVAQSEPKAAGAAVDNFVDPSFVKQLEDQGFYKQLLAGG